MTTANVETKKINILYYWTGSSVAVKIAWSGSWSYRVGQGNKIRLNRGEDSELYNLIIGIDYIDDFLYNNGVKSDDISVSRSSLDSFYMFEADKVYTTRNLTKKFVELWWNYDQPRLWKYEVNKGQGVNFLGEKIPCFSHELVNASFMDTYIDKRIEKSECERLIGKRTDSSLATHMRNVLDAREISEQKETMEAMESYVKRYDDAIQKVINEQELYILEKLAAHFEGYAQWIEDGITKRLEIANHFGLDCGFLYIFTQNEEYTRNRRILANIKHQYSNDMSIDLPYGSQSLTIMRAQFQIVKELVKDTLGITLYHKAMLD